MAEPLLNEDTLRRLESLALVSRRIFRGRTKGERRSKRRGASAEFADYRNYVEGDDLRHIDWNIYGRLDKLFLKLFLEEEDLHVHLLLDTSASMAFGNPSKLDYARRVAAAIGYIGLTNMDRVQVHAFNSGLAKSTQALRSKQQAWQLFDFLEDITPDGSTDLDAACKAFASRLRGSRGVVVAISDFLDPAGYEGAMRRLLSQRMDVYAIHILAAEEVNPALEGDLRLVDVEDGSLQEISVTQPLLAQYRQTVTAFRDELKHYCSKRGGAYAFSSTDIPFDTLVLQTLRRGGLLQ